MCILRRKKKKYSFYLPLLLRIYFPIICLLLILFVICYMICNIQSYHLLLSITLLIIINCIIIIKNELHIRNPKKKRKTQNQCERNNVFFSFSFCTIPRRGNKDMNHCPRHHVIKSRHAECIMKYYQKKGKNEKRARSVYL